MVQEGFARADRSSLIGVPLPRRCVVAETPAGARLAALRVSSLDRLRAIDAAEHLCAVRGRAIGPKLTPAGGSFSPSSFVTSHTGALTALASQSPYGVSSSV